MTTETAAVADALLHLPDAPPEARNTVGAELLHAEHLTDRPGVDHWYCCDRNRALCGADLSGTEDIVGEPNCLPCDALLGAACSPTCDYAKWGAA
jgi:hypothetical protein